MWNHHAASALVFSFSAGILGSLAGTPIVLNPALPDGRNVTKYQTTADGTRVVYRADVVAQGTFELYSVPVGGGTSTLLNGPLTAGASVNWFEVALTGSRVAYCADEAANTMRLHSIEAEGGTAVHVASDETSTSAICATTGSSDHLGLDGIGSRIGHRCPRADAPAGSSPNSVCSVPVLGGPIVARWLGAPSGAGSVFNSNVRSANGRYMIYEVSTWFNSNEMWAFDVIDGSVDGLDGCAGANCAYLSRGFTRDSEWAVSLRGPDANVLRTNELDGPGFGQAPETGQSGSPGRPAISPVPYSGAYRIAYPYRLQFGEEPSDLRVNHVGGDTGSEVTLLTGSDTTLSVDAFSLDGSLLLYRDDGFLYTIPTAGGPPTLLSQGGNVLTARITPDGSRVLYRQGPTTDELYSVPLAGPPSARVKLNGPLVAGGDVSATFHVTADGSIVVYRADERTNGIDELFAVPVTGGVPRRLSHDLADNSIVDVAIAPGDRHLLYRGRQAGHTALEVFSVELDTDADADGTPDRADCDPADPQHGSLAEVGNLVLSHGAGSGPTSLQWTLVSPGGSGAVTFDTLRAEERDAFSGGGGAVVVLDSDTDTSSTDSDTPATIFYYRVRAANACGSTAGPGTVAVSDSDGDGTLDGADVCPADPSASPLDGDGDGAGDDCDVCLSVADADQADGDGDGRGDACDNCPTIPNFDQVDGNGDGRGDACACANVDGDDLCLPDDNCPDVANPDQTDSDDDGIGDACDTP